MSKIVKYLLLIASALVLFIVVLRWKSWHSGAGDGALVRWGRRRLAASEQAYGEARVRKAIRTWQQMWRTADSGRDGRLQPAHDVYLVIDTARHALWIEDRGQILEASHCELLGQLTWRLYRDEGKELTPLSDVARFKRRGIDASRLRPEKIWLVGQGRGKNGSLIFYFNCRTLGSNHAFSFADTRKKWPAPLPQEGVNYYASIMVNEQEYEQSRRTWASAHAGESSSEPIAEDPGEAAWSKVETRLYRTIESQVKKTGFDISDLEVEPGPGWSAAHAHVSAIRRDLLSRNRRSFWQYLFGGWKYVSCYLKIDHLGDGFWYASTVPYGLPVGETLELEFVASAGGALPQEERSRRLAQGREKQHPTTPSASPWQVALPNGATVALLGISRITEEERHWWGPDGSQETFVPEFYPESRSYRESPPEDARLARRYEIVWLVDWPVPSSGATHFSWNLETSFSSHLVPGVAYDRYGEEYRSCSAMDIIGTIGSQNSGMIRYFYVAGIPCTLTDTQTRFALGLRVDQGSIDWVTFKDVSLRPGEDPGFEIIQGKGDTP